MRIQQRRRAVALGLVAALVVVATASAAGAHGDSGGSKHAKHGTHERRTKDLRSAHTMADMPGMTHTDDKGLSLLSNGHHHAIGEEHAMSPAVRSQLAHQVEVTIAVAKRYPTVADATAAGYQRVGPYLPGIGAHFIHLGPENFNVDGVVDDADLEHPLAIIYSGTEPTAQVAGFMYYSMSPKMPKGFAGKNDVWHYHEDLCLKYTAGAIDAPYGLDHSATKRQCEAAGGRLMPQTQWMVHVWSVPGWESRQGLFGEVNPALMCPDGTYYQYRPAQWRFHPLNACRSAA
jgi:hypothetical protein